MILGIDASNIRGGGGLTHLVELLRAADPAVHGFSRIVVWSGRTTLDKIEPRDWLIKSHHPLLDRTLLHRAFWQFFRLSALARGANCNVLFVPGGSFAGTFRPMVTMNQNLLPFDMAELRRYGWSPMMIKLLVLRLVQGSTIRRADGTVFLTHYAKDVVSRALGLRGGNSTVIPHGIDARFACPPREQQAISRYSADRPFRVLYVSIVDMYKHQWRVAEAVTQLRAAGVPVVLDLIGPAYLPALKRLRNTLTRVDPTGELVRYFGAVPYRELHARYVQADLGVFASSCETFGQILTEMMSAGLPVACSNRSAMPELLGDAGEYFDPEDSKSIACALRRLIDSPPRRAEMASASFAASRAFSWSGCADQTLEFLSSIARPNR